MITAERFYQTDGIQFLAQNRKAIIAMDPGLGKTLVAIRNAQQRGARQILVTAGTNAQFTWIKEELPKWWPDHPRVTQIKGGAYKRALLWRGLQDEREFIAVTTPQSFYKDLKIVSDLKLLFDIVFSDEAHKGINRKTQIHRVMDFASKRTGVYNMLSGGMIKRGPQDFWALLHSLDPKEFPTYWGFVNQYTHVVEGHWGLEIVGIKNKEELKARLQPYIFAVSKNDPRVAATLPEKFRQPIPIEMEKTQRRLYDKLSNEMYAEYGKDFVIAPNKMSLFTRHRQLLCCPRILYEGAPLGCAFDEIASRLEETPHAVIYSPYTKAFPHIAGELTRRKHEVVTFQGGMDIDQMKIAKETFVGSGGVALMSIAYAEAISLETSSYGYFLTPSLDQLENYQAEDRQHRTTSEGPVFIFYMNPLDTISDYIFNQILGYKTQGSKKTWAAILDLENLLV